jgi:hypothetical protein
MFHTSKAITYTLQDTEAVTSPSATSEQHSLGQYIVKLAGAVTIGGAVVSSTSNVVDHCCKPNNHQ